MENEITAHRAGKVTRAERLRGRGDQLRRPDLRDRVSPERPQPPGKVPLRRNGNWRKRWRYLGAYLRRGDAVRRPGAGRPAWPDLLGRVGPRERQASRAHPRHRAAAGPWRGLDRARRRRAHGPHRLGAGEGRDPGADRGVAEGRRARADPRLPARGRGPVGGGRLRRPARTTATSGPASGWSPVECDVRIGERRIRCEASRGRGRVLRLPPPPHGVGLVGGRRHDHRRSRGRLEPGQRNQRPASATPSARSGSTASRASRARSRFEGLEAIVCDGARLEFTAEAERSKEESKPGVKYSYRQPFGTFSGSLPGGLELAEGFGVMEHHDAHW